MAPLEATDARWALLIPSVMMFTHCIPFLFAPIKFFKMFYMGNDLQKDAEPHFVVLVQWFVFWIFAIGGTAIGYFEWFDKINGPVNFYLAFGISFLQYVVHFVLFTLTRVINGWHSTNPGPMQKMMMMSWIPGNFIFAIIAFMTIDSDALDLGEDFFKRYQAIVGYGKDDPIITQETAVVFLLIQSIMVLIHVPFFWFYPSKTMQTLYLGPIKPTATDQVNWIAQFHGSWALGFAAIGICGFYQGGQPYGAWMAQGIGQYVAALIFIAQLTGYDGNKYYLGTQPGKFQMFMLASWVPTCIIFGTIFLAAADPEMKP